MLTTLPTIQIVSLGDFVAAVFDQTDKHTPPALSKNVATQVVNRMLLRAGNARALAALQRYRRVQQ